jgi:hypothetical protein
MARSTGASALTGLFGTAKSISIKVRGVVLGAVLLVSFVAPAATSTAQGSSFTARNAATPGVAMVHPYEECGGGGLPC